jgi:hypothetical protein
MPSHSKNWDYRPSSWPDPKPPKDKVDLWMGVFGILSFLAMCAIGAFIVCVWWGLI